MNKLEIIEQINKLLKNKYISNKIFIYCKLSPLETEAILYKNTEAVTLDRLLEIQRTIENAINRKNTSL